MSELPERITRSTSLSSAQQGRARRHTQRAELDVYLHAVKAAAVAQIDQADSQALSDALPVAMDEEINFYDYGKARADGSIAKAEIVAQKVAIFSAINNRRIGRRFS